MKTFTAIALALLVGAGVGYGVFNYMGPKAEAPSAPAIETAQSAEPAKIEPAAAEVVHGADDPVVAKVDGKPVYRTEVLDYIKSLPPQMQQADPKELFPLALDQFISGKIVDEKAAVANLDSDPVVVKRLALAKTQIVRAVYAEQAIDKEFSADLVKKTYDDIVKGMPKVEEVHARHILVDSEAQAKDIITKLNGGAKFEDLAKEFSKDKSNATSGGDLGYFAQTDMVKEFSDAAFALKANEYTKTPVKTQFGFHVIQSLDKRQRPAPKFEDVKLQVEGQVRRDILNKLVETWTKSASIEKFDYEGKPIVAAPANDAAKEVPAATPAPTEEKKAE
ncbi:MAG TPA: rotamase [Rhodospirillaceae bacterium]|nr:rotamase [Rhodospirillaceae bacterium]